ncbi:uncharacterized protein LOC120793093 [Xiphias gladius]|uniref:uncharacterized protein LOC120793093 n=1 Tax=Xiphias gladius TaxID=8245 RepID=UPI001A98E104|nr:uncharacterized protein LOC120793093 [Xiphias gladius]
MANVCRMTNRDIRLMIRLCATSAAIFTGRRNSAVRGWKAIRKEMGLQGMTSARQLKKKWDNLKEKYRVLKNPPEGTENLTKPSSWCWFHLMDEAMSGRLAGTGNLVQPFLLDGDEERAAALLPLRLPTRGGTFSGLSVVDTGTLEGPDRFTLHHVTTGQQQQTQTPPRRPPPKTLSEGPQRWTGSRLSCRKRDRLWRESGQRLTQKGDRQLLSRDMASLERDRMVVERDRAAVERDRAFLDQDRAFLDRDRAFLERAREAGCGRGSGRGDNRKGGHTSDQVLPEPDGCGSGRRPAGDQTETGFFVP